MTGSTRPIASPALGRVFIALTLPFSLVATAQGGPIQFNPSGGGTTYTTSGFNFAGGNALAINAIPNGGPVTVGETFTFLYQTHLLGLVGVNNVAGLNSSYQITEVAYLTETVSSVSGTGSSTTATFALAPGGFNQVNIYENNAVTFNDATGTGFTDGKLIMTDTPTSFNPSQFSSYGTQVAFNSSGTGNQTSSGMALNGSGSTSLNNIVNSPYNSAYFVTPGLFSSTISSNLTSFFDTINASTSFYNLKTGMNVMPNLGSVNSSSGQDIEFQLSGLTQSFTTPEPASIAMTVLGLGGFAFGSFLSRRRRAIA